MPDEKVIDNIYNKAVKRALNGGVSGSAAMAFQVGSMMWLRTTLNYQYKNGTKFIPTIKTLYSQGGIPRFYQGVGPALLQAPLSRFGDTAANMGMMYYLDNNPSTANMPTSIKTFCGSVTAGLWRVNLMPIDTCKTMKQVHGDKGYQIIKDKIKVGGIRTLYHGSLGACSATIIGHFPWFYTYNTLSKLLPEIEKPINLEDNNKYVLKKMGRFACIGFCSSLVSDTCSNSARIIKTSKQTAKDSNTSYSQIVKNIIEKDGFKELFGRGLKTKIMINGIQGIVFTIVWKSLEELLNKE